jgi:hypothetical protein
LSHNGILDSSRKGIKMEKLELVVQALQQRIGELVSNYETHIAVLRAEITQLQQTQIAEDPKEK